MREGLTHFVNGLLCFFERHRPHEMYIVTREPFARMVEGGRFEIKTCACGREHDVRLKP
jgi:hypothetical protein